MTITEQQNGQEVAGRMRLARRLAGMTQEDAARALDVTVRTYARWEKAETLGFLDELDRIARLYDTTPDELLGESDLLQQVARDVEAMRAELAELRGLVEASLPKRRRS